MVVRMEVEEGGKKDVMESDGVGTKSADRRNRKK